MAYQRYLVDYPILAKHILEAWRAIPAAVASDCMNRTQSMRAAIKPIVPGTRLCAQARTVTAMVGDGGIIQVALTLARPGEALAIDVGGVEDVAVWGAVATEAALAHGIAGVVIDGAVRDVADIRRTRFACFCRAAVPRGPHHDFGGIIDARASVGGVPVNPGDLVLGDDDGVVVVPLARADEVLAAARAHLEKEKKWLEGLAAGRTIPEIFGMPTPQIIT